MRVVDFSNSSFEVKMFQMTFQSILIHLNPFPHPQHSCAPNLFVQNVFVDTHDLRFPWVSFFAMHNIRAGSELTWNYNYEVGSVQGKILMCQCGAKNCRGRIL